MNFSEKYPPILGVLGSVQRTGLWEAPLLTQLRTSFFDSKKYGRRLSPILESGFGFDEKNRFEKLTCMSGYAIIF